MFAGLVAVAGLVCLLASPGTLLAVCGDGVLDPGEQCDDFDADSYDGCSKNCATETGWTCPVPGASCQAICGDGIVLGAEQCDQAGFNGASYSCCNPDCTAVPPRNACRQVERSTLMMSGQVGGLRRMILWKASGNIIDRIDTDEDYGNPAETTGYAVCMYDETGGVPKLKTGVAMPPGYAGTEICFTRLNFSYPCWQHVGEMRGFKFRDRKWLDPTSKNLGANSLWLRVNDTGGYVFFRAKGLNLQWPPAVSPEDFLDQDTRVTVQLLNSEGKCWEANFEPPAFYNDRFEFRDFLLPTPSPTP